MFNKDYCSGRPWIMWVLWIDPLVIARENKELSVSYRQVNKLINLDDLSSSSKSSSTSTSSSLTLATEDNTVNDELLDFESDDEETNDQAKPLNWAEYIFIKTFRIIMQLSGCPSLTCLYKILVSLSIASCSAERAMSWVQIIKNRLGSTMLDDCSRHWWRSKSFSVDNSLQRTTCLSLAIGDIINCFARCSSALQKQLVYGWTVFSN